MWRIDHIREDGTVRQDSFLYKTKETAEELYRIAWAQEKHWRKKNIYGYIKEVPVIVECEETVY